MSDLKQTKRELALLRRHRKELLKMAENLLDIAEAGGAVSRDAARAMSNTGLFAVYASLSGLFRII